MEENRGRGAMGMISDEMAYRQYLGGDEAAAAVLVERYGDALTCYLGGWVRDVQEAEDLMIEAFSRMFAKARPIGGDGTSGPISIRRRGAWLCATDRRTACPFSGWRSFPSSWPAARRRTRCCCAGSGTGGSTPP